MIYLKAILLITLTTLFLNSPLFLTYYGVHYGNLIYIIGPIVGIAGVIMLLNLTTFRRFNPCIAKVFLSENTAMLLAFISAAIMARNFDFNSFLVGDINTIRHAYINRDVQLVDQLVPLILVYPFSYISYKFLKTSTPMNLKSMVIILFMVFYGLSTGGRAFIFQIVLLFLFIARPKIFSFKNLIIFVVGIALFSFISLGRNSSEINVPVLLEASVPIKFSKFIKDKSEYPELKDLLATTTLYFGAGVPAFCNKFENLELQILPRSVWGLQPFIERQLMRVGFINHTQEESYSEILNLSKGSGFFRLSWSTGFLDIYFYEGIIMSLAFFIMVAFILFNTQRNLLRTRAPKYEVLTAYNLLFILTIFMTPSYSETTAFFSYVFIYLTQVRIS